MFEGPAGHISLLCFVFCLSFQLQACDAMLLCYCNHIVFKMQLTWLPTHRSQPIRVNSNGLGDHMSLRNQGLNFPQESVVPNNVIH